MDKGFESVKGLFGYKLSSKPSKEITGKTYKFDATENGISVYRNGELVAEEIKMVQFNDNSTFSIGLKDGKKVCFDAINGREFDVAYCSSWRPEYIISTDGDFFKIENNIIYANKCPGKVVIENGKIEIVGGLHLVEGENGMISLADEKGEVVLHEFTTDRNAKFNSTYPKYNSVLRSYYTVTESGKTKLIDAKTESVFFEVEGAHKIEHDDIEPGKSYAILDIDPETKTSVVHIFDKDKNKTSTTAVPGIANYVTLEESDKYPYIGYHTDESTDMFFIDLKGNDITKTIKDANTARWERDKAESARRKAAERAKEQEDYNNSANTRETSNMLMGASLMGLGMPSTGATVMAVTAIQRLKRKLAEEENDNSQSNTHEDEAEFGDE